MSGDMNGVFQDGIDDRWRRAANNVSHMGSHRTNIDPDTVFDPEDTQIKEDILRMIIQYLQDEGYNISSATVQDEANVKAHEHQNRRAQVKRMRKCIKEGEWDTAAKLATKHLKKTSQKGFLYQIYRQEYLELIDRSEYQKAFTYLTTRLKPLESVAKANGGSEFHDLCYLLTCKSVHDADSFRNWPGVMPSREDLADNFQTVLDMESSITSKHAQLPEHRLIGLLQHAVTYQMEFSRYHPKMVPKVPTLLSDYECDVLPNAVKATFIGHSANVKCAHFVGTDGLLVASGSSDNTIRIWASDDGNARVYADSAGLDDDSIYEEGRLSTRGEKSVAYEASALQHDGSQSSLWYGEGAKIHDQGETKQSCRTLRGHTSRIWQMSSSKKGQYIYSASGDGSVKVWDLYAPDANACVSTFAGHQGDVYAVTLHPSEKHFVSGGYDRTIKLYDIATGAIVKTFGGHQAAVSDAIFNPYGNLIVSGSKDNTIRFWDVVSGLCVRTLHQTLGEVTSVELNSTGLILLSGSRNNSNRLWDIRMTGSSSNREDKPLQRFKGHQNTAKNFVRASFGPRESLVLGGSEDGMVYIWDVDSGKLLQRLSGHRGTVYSCHWNARQALFLSCSHDNTLKTWWWDEHLGHESRAL